MFKKKDLTLKEWELLETEKNERLRQLKNEIDALGTGRPEILLRMAEGDRNAVGELKACDEQRDRLKTEIESIQMLLAVIPARKDYARGVGIEAARVPLVDETIAGLTAVAEKARKAAEKAQAANGELLAYLEKFSELEETQSLRLRSRFIDGGMNAMPARFNPNMAGEGQIIDLLLVACGITFDDERLTKLLGEFKEMLSKRVEKVKYHARRLKGEDVPVPEWPYCPKCYETTGYPDASGKTQCRACGTTF